MSTRGLTISVIPEFIRSNRSLLSALCHNSCFPYFFSNASKTEGPVIHSAECHLLKHVSMFPSWNPDSFSTSTRYEKSRLSLDPDNLVF
ncbi:hypothetical protein HanXRQr2_Chr14g0663901 [Helianthus annuus]|uniref:Uncharacterized protein n=1 Tax=Helianthus annuus TaxID=4232 RepID=A0A9K3EC45_HELAN|nr:hypothetical protein HanXRQr2_Chr14g0663901 [Helianthus annuus]KAJ0842044.1 hypothetical protein HanPSC8_Chr14g0637191 [Helianthus annuus]